MEHWKPILKKLLFPGGGWVALAVLLGGASLALTFLVSGDSSPFAYISYVLSSYALVILVAAVIPAIPRGYQFLHSIPLAHRWMTDKYFSVWCGLISSFAINLGLSVLKLVYAVRYSSFWDGGLAIYNILLCIARLYLLKSFPKEQYGQSYAEELHRYRMTAVFLFLLVVPLAIISTLIVLKGNGYFYPGTLVYVMAVHAFYGLILGIINTAKYRKFNSPVLSASKTINLTTALVSMFSLETALIAQFGEGQERFRFIMTAITAFVVCATVLGIAIYMVRKSGKQLKNVKGE